MLNKKFCLYLCCTSVIRMTEGAQTDEKNMIVILKNYWKVIFSMIMNVILNMNFYKFYIYTFFNHNLLCTCMCFEQVQKRTRYTYVPWTQGYVCRH